jgi:hypothetical protein
MKHAMTLAALALAIASPSDAADSNVVVDNVPLEIQREDFINRTVAIAPYINLKNPDDIPSYGYVARVISRGQSRLTLQGEFINYSSVPNDITPYMRGGDALSITFTGTKDLACNGSVCQRAHHFIILITHLQITSHSEDGNFSVQFRSADGRWKPTITIPVAHVNALINWKP